MTHKQVKYVTETIIKEPTLKHTMVERGSGVVVYVKWPSGDEFKPIEDDGKTIVFKATDDETAIERAQAYLITAYENYYKLQTRAWRKQNDDLWDKRRREKYTIKSVFGEKKAGVDFTVATKGRKNTDG